MSDVESLVEKLTTATRAYDVEDEGFHGDYIDWDETTSRVVSGPIGSFKFPGRSWPTRAEARAYWQRVTGGRILKEYKSPGRWCFRIPRSGVIKSEDKQ